MINSMSANVSTLGESVWYVDSGASNHMTGHGEWFRDMQDLERPGYVEIGDDTSHPIKHTVNVPLTLQDGKVKYLADVLHVCLLMYPLVVKMCGMWIQLPQII